MDAKKPAAARPSLRDDESGGQLEHFDRPERVRDAKILDQTRNHGHEPEAKRSGGSAGDLEPAESSAQALAIEPGDGTRERILKMATQLFADLGFEGASTREIAAQSQVNISLISYYFGGKEGLYRAIIAEHAATASARFSQVMTNLRQKDIDAKAVRVFLTEVVNGVLQTKMDHPAVSQILQREIFFKHPLSRDIYEKSFAPLLEQAADFLRVAQKKNVLRADINVYTFFSLILDAVHGYVASQNCRIYMHPKALRLPDEKDQFVKHLVHIFLDGAMK